MSEPNYEQVAYQITQQTLRASNPELASIAKRGRYALTNEAFNGEGEQVQFPCFVPTTETPVPRPTNSEPAKVFAFESVDALSKPPPNGTPTSRTRFLTKAIPERLDFGTFAEEAERQREGLAQRALSDLSTLRDEARNCLRKLTERIASGLMGLIPPLQVLYWQTWRAIDAEPNTPWDDLPDEVRHRLLKAKQYFQVRVWIPTYTAVPAAEIWGDDFSTFREQFPEVSADLVSLQAPALEYALKIRDDIIAAALPIEFRRIACEVLLWEAINDEPVAPPDEDLAGGSEVGTGSNARAGENPPGGWIVPREIVSFKGRALRGASWARLGRHAALALQRMPANREKGTALTPFLEELEGIIGEYDEAKEYVRKAGLDLDSLHITNRGAASKLRNLAREILEAEGK